MSDDNKRNIMFFESTCMRGLYEQMDAWQVANRKRFHSTAIHKDGDLYCCIALSNPTEVIITNSWDQFSARVSVDGSLHTKHGT